MSETPGSKPPSQRSQQVGKAASFDALVAAIAGHFELAMAKPEDVEADCARLRAQVGAPDGDAFQNVLGQLLPLLYKRLGPVAKPVFDLLAAGLPVSKEPWALLGGLLGARDPELVRRALDLASQHASSGAIPVDDHAIGVLARAVDRVESPLAEVPQLATIASILERLPAPRPGSRAPLLEVFLASPDLAARRLAARILDLHGEPASRDVARQTLGSEPHEFLAPYLEYTRASHLDLLALVEEPEALPRLVAALQRAEAATEPALLKDVIATLGWTRLNLGLEAEPLVALGVANSFPLTATPAEAVLLEQATAARRQAELTLFTAHGGRRAEGTADSREADSVARFRAYNLTHAEALSDLLDLAPLTAEKVNRIVERMDRIVEDFTALFAAHSEEAVALPEHYATLRGRVLQELEAHGAQSQLSAELTRLVQMFEDPTSLATVHTLHGLKRYLHQQGLRLGMRLVEGGRATDRSVDVVLASGKKIGRAIRGIQYVDFEPDAAQSQPGATPFAVATLAREFARQLVAGCEKFPNVKIFCYGNEVHYYLAFANHPAFLRVDYSPPLLGGMVDLEYYGVSKYELDAHPNIALDAIGILFRRLEFDLTVEHTHVHARFDKERSLDLGTLVEKAETMLRLAPYLMDLDWVVGQIALPEPARHDIARAWAEFFVDWGVVPMTQVLSKDRLGIVTGYQRGPAGEQEILWSGDGPYHDRYTVQAPSGFFEALHDALERLGLSVEPTIGTMRLGQMDLERAALRPLREAQRRGEIVPTATGFERTLPHLFEIEHEAELFAGILAEGGEALRDAARVAALVAPLERALRFRTTGALQGCLVQRARLARPGDSLELYALRDADGMIRLAFFGHGEALWRQRGNGTAAWKTNRSTDAGALAAILRAARYLTPSMELEPPVADARALRALFESTAVHRFKPLPGERLVTGLRASPGKAVAKVVLDTTGRIPSDFDGAILVAPTVRPEDNTSIYHASGVVSTGGGILSHAGLIAMQFHKPALIVPGRWERERDGTVCLVYRTTEFVEDEKDVNGFRVTARRDIHENEHRLHDGELVILDADEGTLRVLGGDREVLSLHESFRLLRAAGDRLTHASEARDVLAQRGVRLRARHQIEKLLQRLKDPEVTRYAVEEILLGDELGAGGEDTSEKVALLSILLENPRVGLATRGFLEDIAAELFRRDRAAFDRATRDIPTSESLVDILSLRLEALHARAALGGGLAALQASGLTLSPPDADDVRAVAALARARIEELRAACWARTEDASSAPVADPRLRHRMRQLSRFHAVLGASEAEGARFDALRSRVGAADEAACERLGDRPVLFSGDCGHEVASLIGWKAANLAEVERLGGRGMTPPWFVVTDRAFQEMLASPFAPTRSGVEDLVGEARTLGEAIAAILARADLADTQKSSAIRELWRETPLPPHLSADLADAYARLTADPESPPHVAVRSSACEEDAEIAARAGEFETFLFIRGQQELGDALRRAWSGLWTERAIHNRTVLGAGGAHLGGGIIVQRIVWSRVSGVLQTVNVAERNLREIVVNAGLGLGEGVVSGLVGADQIVVAKEGDLLGGPLRFRYVTGDKREQVVFDARAGSGTTRSECLYHQRFRPALEYVELCELVRDAVRLESAYGHPLDIEFGIEANRLWVLQARPVPIAHAILAETLERYPLVSKDDDTRRRHDDPGAARPLQGVAHDPT